MRLILIPVKSLLTELFQEEQATWYDPYTLREPESTIIERSSNFIAARTAMEADNNRIVCLVFGEVELAYVRKHFKEKHNEIHATRTGILEIGSLPKKG